MSDSGALLPPEQVVPYPVVANIAFAEGPIFDKNGYLYFVNYLREGTLGRMAPDGTVEVWVRTGGRANGLKCDGQGNIVAADMDGRRVTRFHPLTRQMQVLTDSFEGEPYLPTNDVCLDLQGNVYFSAPGDGSPDEPVGAVYRIDMDSENQPAGVKRLDDGIYYPNGLAVHPDQRRFFLAETGMNRILGYDLGPDGTALNRRIVHQFPNDTVDGMMFDEHGRLWIARWINGTVDVLDVDTGDLLISYDAGGSGVTNLCWWEESIYVTVAGRHSIHRMDVGVRGARVIP